MSEDEDTPTQAARKRKIGAAVLALWELFNDLPTWKAVAPMLLAGYMGVDAYNDGQDKKRLEWAARSEARRIQAEAYQADVTNRLERIEGMIKGGAL